MADSHLFQWFTHTGFVDAVRPVSKSTIARFEKMFAADEVAELIHELNRAVTDKRGADKLLYRETALRFDAIFADTTCVKSNIHFPVDWIFAARCNPHTGSSDHSNPQARSEASHWLTRKIHARDEQPLH